MSERISDNKINTSGLCLRSLSEMLSNGKLRSVDLVSSCLGVLENSEAAEKTAIVKSYEKQALTIAASIDGQRDAGVSLSPFAGIPISIKDNIDEQGGVTRCGANVTHDMDSAKADALAVKRLRKEGFIVIGRTQMSEFALTPIGLNPRGTPRAPWRRESDNGKGHAPGGSSSGAAVSVADGMCFGALGTDTGGSCRVPAAFCRITGYKPTSSRIPLDGVFPLSPTLDSVGVLAKTVNCCAILSAVMAGEEYVAPKERISSSFLRLGVVKNAVDRAEPEVAEVFNDNIAKLVSAGVDVHYLELPEIDALQTAATRGGLPVAEASFDQAEWMQDRNELYDPVVMTRLLAGSRMSAADYLYLLQFREDITRTAAYRTSGFDAVLMPTAPILPPLMSECKIELRQATINKRLLETAPIVNFLDSCAISIPCQAQNSLPVGMTIMGRANEDAHLFVVATAIEKILTH